MCCICVFIVVPVSRRCSASVTCRSEWCIYFRWLFCAIRERHWGGTLFLLQCIRQSVFGMIEITTIVEYTLHRLKSSLCEEWTEGKVTIRKCVRQGFVDFCDLRGVLTDLIDLLPSIRPYIRCTGKPEAKDSPDRVSYCTFRVFFLQSSDVSVARSGGGFRRSFPQCSLFVLFSRCRVQIGGWWRIIWSCIDSDCSVSFSTHVSLLCVLCFLLTVSDWVYLWFDCVDSDCLSPLGIDYIRICGYVVLL